LKRQRELEAEVRLACTGEAGEGLARSLRPPIGVSNLYIAFPTGEYKNWTACQALFAHGKSAAAQKPKSKQSLMWATILHRTAWYAE
jgi:hypothetical protein